MVSSSMSSLLDTNLPGQGTYFFINSKKHTLLALSYDQLRQLDELVYFFAQLFAHTTPNDVIDSSFSSDGIWASDGSLTGQITSPPLPGLQGFNDFLFSIWDNYYTESTRHPGCRPVFRPEWNPFVYQFQSLRINPSMFAEDLSIDMLSPTPTNPTRRIVMKYMSAFEGRTYPFFENFHKLGRSDILTYFKSSRQMQSIMHAARIKGSGQLDFATVIGGFAITMEYYGGGETIYVQSTGYLDETYGVDNDKKAKEGRETYHIPLIGVSIDNQALEYHDDNSKNIGRICPSIVEDDALRLLTAMALIYHPA
ncbi:MAG: hypothetical protein ACTSYU_13305, partial [Promethearchaeota archaeon]